MDIWLIMISVLFLLFLERFDIVGRAISRMVVFNEKYSLH